MFGSSRDVDFWSVCIRKGLINLERWQVQETSMYKEKEMENAPGDPFLSEQFRDSFGSAAQWTTISGRGFDPISQRGRSLLYCIDRTCRKKFMGS